MTRTTRVMPPAPLVSERMIGEEDLPVARVDIELSSVPDELELINSTPGTRTALALIRLHSHPVGTVLLDVSESLSWQRHSAVVWASTCDAVNAHLAADGMPTVHGVESLREPTGRPPECIRRRAELLADAPAITVVVATRERPRSLRDCLEALLRMDYPNYRIVVVDNDPVTEWILPLGVPGLLQLPRQGLLQGTGFPNGAIPLPTHRLCRIQAAALQFGHLAATLKLSFGTHQAIPLGLLCVGNLPQVTIDLAAALLVARPGLVEFEHFDLLGMHPGLESLGITTQAGNGILQTAGQGFRLAHHAVGHGRIVLGRLHFHAQVLDFPLTFDDPVGA